MEINHNAEGFINCLVENGCINAVRSYTDAVVVKAANAFYDALADRFNTIDDVIKESNDEKLKTEALEARENTLIILNGFKELWNKYENGYDSFYRNKHNGINSMIELYVNSN